MAQPLPPSPAIRSRGTAENPTSRFERLALEPDTPIADDTAPPTAFFADPSRSIVARNDSPDIPFDASLNAYRGCEHGCAYCYARPTHEFLGLSAGIDFETRILVKPRAPDLLRAALAAPRWRPQVVAMSGVTDPYQPAEKRLRLTRGCLEVLLEFGNPVSLVTKSRLIERDVDLLRALAERQLANANLSITTLDASLQRALEPRASRPRSRLAAIRRLADAGVPVGVMVAPVIPGLTDHEIPKILAAAARAGATHANFLVIRLPHGVKALFEAWLERHRPERREKVLARIRALRAGALNDPRFGHRHRGTGIYAEQIERLFEVSRRRLGLARQAAPLRLDAFRRPGPEQQTLFP